LTSLGRFFTQPSVRSAILVYIIVVAVIYHYLLATLWNPQGWQFVADTIEHVVAPALYVYRLGSVRAEGNAEIEIGFCLARLSPRLRHSFFRPRRRDRLLSLTLHRCEPSRLRQRAHQHAGADPCLWRAQTPAYRP
jgi:hypothetical protein